MANIKDVAAKAGVSLSTVSIIVNNKAEERKISKKTQEKVFSAIVELGYTPNISAKKLKIGTNEPLTIALFWTFDFRRGMITRFFSGLQKKLQEDNSSINIVIYPYNGDELYKERHCFTEGYFHAAIIANATPMDIDFLEKTKLSIPIVLYNRFSDYFSSVNMDDWKIGKIAAEHLIEKSYKKPALLSSHTNFPGAEKRREAFIAEMNKLGVDITPSSIFTVSNSVKGGYTFGTDEISMIKENGFDCFFCDSDSISLGLQNSLISQGINIPKDIGIIAIGNGDPQYSEFSNPPLTVIDIPLEEMAYSCCDLINSQIKKINIEVNRKTFDTVIHKRKSTDK